MTVEFGDRIDPQVQAQVRTLDLALAAATQCGRIEGIVESIPTFRSLTVVFDPLVTNPVSLATSLSGLSGEHDATNTSKPRKWRLPACYDGEFAPDIAEVAARADAGTADVIRLHTGTEYVVYMLGFLPGFPFMGDLPAALQLPRRAEPRLRVPPGSVAIATGLTAIYPWESPGGWHLLARCPVRLFDPARPDPALLQPGDRVSFFRVDADEYARLDRELASGRLDPHRWCEGRTHEEVTR